MKNVYEVLRQKEMELARLEKEVEALRLVAPMLSEEKEASELTRMSVNGGSLNGSSLNGSSLNGGSLNQSANQQPIRIPQPTAVPVTAAAVTAARTSGWEETAKRWP